MKLPLCDKKKTSHPKNHKCPVCGTKFKGDFVVFSGGAMFGTAKSMSMDERMFGFADIHAHFDSSEYYHMTTIASDVHMGQFEITVCSHSCLRKLLCDIVDESQKHYLKQIKKVKHGH